MEIKNVFYEGKVLWSMVDANMHLRHSAYADFAAQTRLEVIQSLGFNADKLQELKIGPILFREELIYMREVKPNDMIKVTCEMTKGRSDGSRWSFEQKLYRGDDILAAVINVDGAWIDVEKRRLTALPPEWAAKFLEIPKSEHFQEEIIPQKTINPNKKMTPLEEKYEAAKKRVMELPERPSNEKMLEIYSLAKQAEIGDINIDKTAMFDFVAAAKYNSWSKKKGIAKEVAMQQYVDFIESLFQK